MDLTIKYGDLIEVNHAEMTMQGNLIMRFLLGILDIKLCKIPICVVINLAIYPSIYLATSKHTLAITCIHAYVCNVT